MADAGMSANEERRSKQPLNNEEGNLRDGELWVYLNDSQNNKPELKRIVRTKI